MVSPLSPPRSSPHTAVKTWQFTRCTWMHHEVPVCVWNTSTQCHQNTAHIQFPAVWQLSSETSSPRGRLTHILCLLRILHPSGRHTQAVCSSKFYFGFYFNILPRDLCSLGNLMVDPGLNVAGGPLTRQVGLCEGTTQLVNKVSIPSPTDRC